MEQIDGNAQGFGLGGKLPVFGGEAGLGAAASHLDAEGKAANTFRGASILAPGLFFPYPPIGKCAVERLQSVKPSAAPTDHEERGCRSGKDAKSLQTNAASARKNTMERDHTVSLLPGDRREQWFLPGGRLDLRHQRRALWHDIFWWDFGVWHSIQTNSACPRQNRLDRSRAL